MNDAISVRNQPIPKQKSCVGVNSQIGNEIARCQIDNDDDAADNDDSGYSLLRQ